MIDTSSGVVGFQLPQDPTRAIPSFLWQRAKVLFDHIVTLCGPAQDKALKDIAAHHPELCRAVATLLENDRSDDFLEAPWRPPDDRIEAEAETEKLGTGCRLGPYRIEHEIGRGGSGIVFLAQREDGEIKHRVAVKVLPRGPGSKARQRFQRERRILSNFDHPNIVRLIDSGTARGGQPYLILELIEGLPITTYCDRQGLGIEQRLRLFCAVCHTVHYAHGNLVVHRDLKPSNILVTEAEGVKLLDFGIAEHLDARRAPDRLRPMTPSYASPEQILGGDLSTSSDIYSLGVLLYELVCGRLPHDDLWAGLLWPKVSGDIMPPSAAWAGSPENPGQTAALARAAKARNLSPQQLQRKLCGALDHIVMRALRQKPHRRWVSADQMASNIRRHLVEK